MSHKEKSELRADAKAVLAHRLTSRIHLSKMMDVVPAIAAAQTAAQQGNHKLARTLLRGLLLQEPNHELAWLCFASVAENNSDAVYCLKRVLKINPSNKEAQQKLSALLKSSVAVHVSGFCPIDGGPGQWLVLLQSGPHVKEINGREAKSTQNRTELRGVVEGLAAIKVPSRVIVHLDSEYIPWVVDSKLEIWKANGWKTSEGETVANRDLWQVLDQKQRGHLVDWQWRRPAFSIGRQENLFPDSLKELRAVRAALEADVAALTSQYSDIKSQVEAIVLHRDDLNLKITSLAQEEKQRAGIVQELQSAIDRLETSKANAVREKAEVEAELTQIKVFKGEFLRLKERLRMLEKANETLTQQYQDIQGRHKKLQSDYERLAAKQESIASAGSPADKASLQMLQGKLDEAKMQLQALSLSYEEAQKQLSDKDHEIEELLKKLVAVEKSSNVPPQTYQPSSPAWFDQIKG